MDERAVRGVSRAVEGDASARPARAARRSRGADSVSRVGPSRLDDGRDDSDRRRPAPDVRTVTGSGSACKVMATEAQWRDVPLCPPATPAVRGLIAFDEHSPSRSASVAHRRGSRRPRARRFASPDAERRAALRARQERAEAAARRRADDHHAAAGAQNPQQLADAPRDPRRASCRGGRRGVVDDRQIERVIVEPAGAWAARSRLRRGRPRRSAPLRARAADASSGTTPRRVPTGRLCGDGGEPRRRARSRCCASGRPSSRPSCSRRADADRWLRPNGFIPSATVYRDARAPAH